MIMITQEQKQQMKQATALVRFLNYKCKSTKDFAKLETTLQHMLRIMNSLARINGEEWNLDQTKDDYVIIDNKKYCIGELSQEELFDLYRGLIKDYEKLLEGMPKLEKQKFEKLKKARRKKRAAIMKLFTDEEQTDVLKEYFKEYLDFNRDTIISQQEIKEANAFLDAHCKNSFTKKKAFKKYAKMQDEFMKLTGYEKEFESGKFAAMQETLFKLPNVPVGDIPAQSYIDIVQGYYKKYFPNHEIKALAVHGSENYEVRDGSGKVVGLHVHAYINTKNKLTGDYDLLALQRKLSNDYMLNNPDFRPDINREWLDGRPLRKYRRKRRGGVLQSLTADEKIHNSMIDSIVSAKMSAHQNLLFDHINEEINKYNYHASKIKVETPEQVARRYRINADANKPKHLREFNYVNREMEKNLDIRDEAKLETEAFVKKANIAQQKLNESIKKREQLTEESEKVNAEVQKNIDKDKRMKEVLKRRQREGRQKLNEIDDEIAKAEKLKEVAVESFKQKQEIEIKEAMAFYESDIRYKRQKTKEAEEEKKKVEAELEELEKRKYKYQIAEDKYNAVNGMIDMVEKIYTDKSHILVLTHKGLMEKSKTYATTVFPMAKSLYFKLYNSFKGQPHKLDTENRGNKRKRTNGGNSIQDFFNNRKK